MAGHKEVKIDPDKPYEANIIGFRGILYFSGGLFLLIVLTFGLMYTFQFWVLAPQAAEEDEKNRNPLALTAEEKLPPEPRLQSAPGFGVDTPGGRLDLELREPQAEYRELLKQWEDQWKNGTKDEKTGTVVTLSISDAKDRLLKDGQINARSPEESRKTLEEATSLVSASSAGRLASEKRR